VRASVPAPIPRVPIYALFDEHRQEDDPREWWWRGFYSEDDGPMRPVVDLPAPANYLEDPSALVFTPEQVRGMRVDSRHILSDHLLPLDLGGAPGRQNLALVVERTEVGGHRASTVLGNDLAYRQSRVVARPDPEWLGRAWLQIDEE
jgi:hypothetical protein